MTHQAKNTFKKLAAVAVLGALALGSASAFARATGALTWNNKGSSFTDGETWITFFSNQGAQGTYWVWRWQKVYDKFTTFCASTTCTAIANETRTESVQTSIGFEASAKAEYKAVEPQIKGSFQRTTSVSKSFGFSWNATIPRGMNAYGGVIALDKYIPAADIRGVWERTGKSRATGCSRAGCSYQYEYRWNNEKTVGTWRGHQKAQHRTYLCTTRTVVTPAVGQGLPAGCIAPQIPY